MFEIPRRGRQARNFTTNFPKILDLKSSSEQIFSENWRWLPLSRIQDHVHPDDQTQPTFEMSKMFARIICQTIEWEVNYFTAKEKWYFGFYFLMRVSKTSWFCLPQLLLLHPPVFALFKPVKPGQYGVLRPLILLVLLTLYGKMT